MTGAGKKAAEEGEGCKMQIEVVAKEKKLNRLTLLVKDVTPTFMNTLRRNIIDEVPTMAIKEVEFRKNSSALYDEIIALRLGLIPLTTDLKSYNLPEECTCNGEGCLKCTLKLTLSKKTPGMVYASEIKSKDPKVRPAFPEMPIVKLLKGQELEFEATATLGRGKDHMKYSPCHCWYRNVPEIECDKVKDAGKIIKVCPTNVFEVKGNRLNVKNVNACILCGACADADENMKLNIKTNQYLMYIESFGQLEPEEILKQGITVLDKQLDEFEKIIPD